MREKIKKKMKEKMQIEERKFKCLEYSQKGITLVSLVITIIVLLILAGVSLSIAIGENGIITRTEKVVEDYEISAEKERLELVKAEVILENDKNSNESLIDRYKDKLIEKGILDEEEITENPDGSIEGITDEGFLVTIKPADPENPDNPNGDIIIEIEGKADALPVKIVNIKLTTAEGIIEVDVTVKRAEGATYTYYYKKAGEDYKVWKENITDTNIVIEGLEENVEYTIKVEATNKHGTVSKEATGRAGKIVDLDESNTTFTYNPSTWTNGDVTVTIATTVTGYTLQYSTDGSAWNDYTTPITVSTNGTIYARLVDTTGQEGGAATGNVTKIERTIPTIGAFTGTTITSGTSGTITATTIADTGGSGLKGYYISTNSTKPTATGVTWTPNTSSTISYNVTAPGTYHIWVIDNADNISDSKSCTVTQRVTAMTLDKTSATLSPGETTTIKVTLSPTSASSKNVTWNSSNTGVATINPATTTANGATVTITAVAAGTTTITATTADGSLISKTCTITVETASLVDQVSKTNYGDYVDYSIDLNSNGSTTDDWKIFYNDGTNIFIIAAEYLPNTKLPSATNMGTYSGRPYSAYWPSTSNLTRAGSSAINTTVASKYLLGWRTTYPSSTNNNAKAVAALLDTSAWSSFVDSNYADSAIGGPTLEMYVKSWNAKGYTTLYCNNSNATGYYVGTSSSPTSTYVNMSSDTNGYADKLYYPYTSAQSSTNFYWLASPSADSTSRVMRVYSSGIVDSIGYGFTYGGVRPVVCLKSGISATQNSSGIWTLSK